MHALGPELLAEPPLHALVGPLLPRAQREPDAAAPQRRAHVGSEEEPAPANEHPAPCRTRRAHAAVWVSSGDGSQKRQCTGEQQQAYPVEAAAGRTK